MSISTLPSWQDFKSTGLAECGDPGTWLSLSGPLKIPTPYGILTPQFEPSDRRLRVMPALFYPDGSVKSLALQERTLLETPVGEVWAELVSFYPNGALRRVFPADGEITGYWTVDDEYASLEPATIQTGIGRITHKFVSLYFYPSGSLKSLAIWPQDSLETTLPGGLAASLRFGLAFYEHGPLRRVEPAAPLSVPTPLGRMRAFDPYAIGLHGDAGSLVLDREGKVIELITVQDRVKVEREGSSRFAQPGLRISYCNASEMEPVPLRVKFSGDQVCFEGTKSFNVPFEGTRFTLSQNLSFNESFGASCACS